MQAHFLLPTSSLLATVASPSSQHHLPRTVEAAINPALNILICAEEFLALYWRSGMGGKVPESVLKHIPDAKDHGASASDGFGAR